MSTYTWQRAFDGDHSYTVEAIEWTERWTVLGYVQGAAPPWYDLGVDRPDLVAGQPHLVVPNAYVVEFIPKQIGTSNGWIVEVRYAKRSDNEQFDVLPWLRPAQISATMESVEVPNFTRYDGTPWINTAGDIIAGLTKREMRIVFRVRKNVQTVPTWFLSYADGGGAVNSDHVVIKGLAVPPGYLQMSDPTIDEDETENVNGVDVTYVPLNFAVTYNPRTWITKVYNRGLYQLYEGRHVPCLDDDHEPVSEPMFLNNAGEMLTYPLNPDDVVTLEGWDYPRLPFSALPLT